MKRVSEAEFNNYVKQLRNWSKWTESFVNIDTTYWSVNNKVVAKMTNNKSGITIYEVFPPLR